MNPHTTEKSSWTDEQVTAALSQAKARLQRFQEKLNEPLALIGIGCRFPGAYCSGKGGPDEFWELLRRGRCAVVETPADRWDTSLTASVDKEPGKITANRGAYLDSVDQFDAAFFGITRREAATLDPQQRLLLEVAWETLEHAALDPDRLRGSRTGVFVGICSNDYLHRLTTCDRKSIDAYMGTGNAHSAAAGRLSYFLNWRGPSVAVDTACSSSLVAVHLAARSLRYGDCDMALVAGVNLILTPELSINLSQAGMLSPTGLCHTFSASADGFVRGEGCGAVLLKRLSRALADGDRILCVVRGSASTQDGRSNGLTAPNGVSQQAVLRDALADANVLPEQIDYIEAHGTGTELGDPIEMGALGAVFAPDGGRSSVLRVGSVKPNIGHLEGAAGVAGLIKASLALHHEAIPPNLHFDGPSPHIDWELPIEVPTVLTDWRCAQRRRMAGVSSFGFTGTNAHVVLEEAPEAETPGNDVAHRQAGTCILTISARTPTALKRQAARYVEALSGDCSAADFCYTANTGRAHFEHRLAVPGETAGELAGKLARFADGPDAPGDRTPGDGAPGVMAGSDGRDIAVHWLFGDDTGGDFGPVLLGKPGRQLYQCHPGFREELDRCEEALRDCWPRPLKTILWEDERPKDAADALPALFCLQFAAAQLWLSWGISPRVVLGHGLGEYAAACMAGVFSLQDALKLVTQHAELQAASSDARDSQKAFAARAEEIAYTRPGYPYVSTAVGSSAEREIAGAEYWTRRLQEPIDLAAAAKRAKRFVSSHGVLCLEVGTGTSLTDAIRAAHPGAESTVLPGLTGDDDEWKRVVENLSRLYVAGATIDWQAVEPVRRKRVSLPTYAFERKRYWFDESAAGRDGELDAGRIANPSSNPVAGQRVHPLLGARLDFGGQEIVFETDPSELAYLSDHRIGSAIVFPAAGFLELAMAAGFHAGQERLTVTDLAIERPLSWTEGQSCRVQVVLARLEGGFECRIVRRSSGAWRTYAACRLVPQSDVAGRTGNEPGMVGRIANPSYPELQIEEHYRRYREAGMNYGPAFRGVRRVVCGDRQAWGEVALPRGLDETGYLLHPALLDACLQVTAGALDEQFQKAWLPVHVARYCIVQPPAAGARLHVHARIRPADDDEANLHVDLHVADEEGGTVAVVERLLLKSTQSDSSPDSAGSPRMRKFNREAALKVLHAPPGEQRAALQEYLHGCLVDIMELTAEEIPLDKPLNSLGLDSLMAFELSAELERNLGARLPMEVFLQDLSLADFASMLASKLQAARGSHDGELTAIDAGLPGATEENWMEGAL